MTNNILSKLDYNKKNLDEIIEIGNKTLEELYSLAIESQDQEVYRNLIQLIKVLGDINLKSSQNNEAINNKKYPNIVNNTMFVGTPLELLKLLENNEKNYNR